MKDRRNLFYIVSIALAVVAVCTAVYIFREEIRGFFERLCERAGELKDKAASKISEFGDDSGLEDYFVSEDVDE